MTYFESELRRTFPEASVVDYEQWISRMTNDLKDRHVSASAVSAEAKFIATFNLRHFKSADLAPWDLTAIHPQQFLANLFQERPDIVRLKLREQAERRKIDVTALLGHLRLSVPQFVDILQA